MMGLSQKPINDPKSAAFSFTDDDDTEMSKVTLNGVTNVKFHEDEDSMMLMTDQ